LRNQPPTTFIFEKFYSEIDGDEEESTTKESSASKGMYTSSLVGVYSS
jgi:hypothetical protein